MLKGRWPLFIGILLLFFLAGLFAIYSSMSYLTRELAEKRVPGLSFTDLEIGWNRLTIQGISYTDPTSKRLLLSADSLFIAPSFTSFFSNEIQVSSIQIENPYVYVVRDSEGRLHLPLPRSDSNSAAAEASTGTNHSSEDAAVFRVAIDKVTGTGGSGEFVDQTVEGPAANYRFSELNFLIEEVHYPPERAPVRFDVEALIDHGRASQLELGGWYDFVAPSADLDFRLDDFSLEQAEPYLRERVRVEDFGRGRIGTTADVQMTDGRYKVAGQIVLTEFVISQLQERLLGFPTEILQAFLRDAGGELVIPFSFEGMLGEKKEPFDPGALLMRRLEEELGSNAGLLDLLGDRDSQQLKERLEELKEKGKRLKDLFR